MQRRTCRTGPVTTCDGMAWCRVPKSSRRPTMPLRLQRRWVGLCRSATQRYQLDPIGVKVAGRGCAPEPKDIWAAVERLVPPLRRGGGAGVAIEEAASPARRKSRARAGQPPSGATSGS